MLPLHGAWVTEINRDTVITGAARQIVMFVNGLINSLRVFGFIGSPAGYRNAHISGQADAVLHRGTMMA